MLQKPEKPKVCKDCVVEADERSGWPESGIRLAPPKRPAPYPGPRCHTHEKARKKAARARERERNTIRRYGITAAEKAQVKAHQGGMCICGPWTGYNGNSRELSTDHDHKTLLIRGELCKHCNDLLGRIRDDPEYLRRMIDYLENPPAVQVLGERYAPQ